jgi:predicted membrane channel-forming protein YqfA (hemolysin III family)
MSDLVRALADSARAAVDLVAASLMLLGGLLMLGAYVYRVFVHPEWTSHEAVAALWPFFVVGSATLMLGWLVDRREPTIARARRPNPRARDLPQ